MHRIAVFTYEDADDTGLGDAAAALVARKILVDSGANSIGVIFFEGGLSPSTEFQSSYFDRVERVTAAQDVTLAVWGIIRRTGDGLQIDSFLQVPEPSLAKFFTWQLTLPAAMQGGALTARLRPERALLRRGVFSAADAEGLRSASVAIGRVREEPSTEARIVGELPANEVYYLTERRDGWVRLQASRVGGWAPSQERCPGECENLLTAAAFAGGVLRYMADGSVPASDETLSPESRAIADQLSIMERLNSEGLDDLGAALGDALDWQNADVIPPGGAAFANLRALATLALGLKQGFRQVALEAHGIELSADERVSADLAQEIYDSIELPAEGVKDVVADLAEASQFDPRNTDVLGNLSVLFDYLGDSDRALLAKELVDQYGSR